MKYVTDTTYKGHEIVLYKDGAEFAVDVRSDSFDGEMLAGWSGYKRAGDALSDAKKYVDVIEGEQ